ncbi:hypothetical protein [Bifidobacterium phasiani]|uniref:Uncharacterized protein n=1 Tax=Bifidobacterium phasiani TaxID=2834431 RepID=A0ABS6W6G7_9BIFI|nr:hypothetical protein [Bifidobacterium phasiani]MBW3082083.1 hypothetical protein [Bifidobacterium phasiani]
MRFVWRTKSPGVAPLSLLAAAMLFAVACAFVAAPIAAAEDTATVTAPEGATHMWVDVEYADENIRIEGTLNDEPVGFTASPSGATAICDVAAGSEYRLSLTASAQTDALVALTFADDDDVIVQESSAQAHLDQTETPIEPQEPSNPGTGDGAGANGGAGNASHTSGDGPAKPGVVGKTGSPIMLVASVGAVLCAAGVFVAVARRRAGRAARGADEGHMREVER